MGQNIKKKPKIVTRDYTEVFRFHWDYLIDEGTLGERRWKAKDNYVKAMASGKIKIRKPVLNL